MAPYRGTGVGWGWGLGSEAGVGLFKVRSPWSKGRICGTWTWGLGLPKEQS